MNRIRWIAPVVAGIFALGACGDADVAEDEFETTEEIGVEETTPMTETTTAYAQWDMDADRRLSQAEFGNWAGERFASHDADGSGVLDEAEIGDRLDETRLAEWDANGDAQIDRAEFEAGLFVDLDTNQDGFLDETEWSANVDWL